MASIPAQLTGTGVESHKWPRPRTIIERYDVERLETLLLEGLEGEETKLTRQDFDSIRKEALAELKRRKKQR